MGKNTQCKGFRKHNWIERLNTKPDPRLDYMAMFYLGWKDIE
jgi:hypothetical protein